MDADYAAQTARKVLEVIEALRAGKLKVPAGLASEVETLLALPIGPTGLPNIDRVPAKTLAFARSTALALTGLAQMREDYPQDVDEAADGLSLEDAQCRLFELFEALFVSLIGVPSVGIGALPELKDRMLYRLRNDRDDEAAKLHQLATSELFEFYQGNASTIFRAAKALGGVKSVCGGQRGFNGTALEATRIAGLYCDTQLVPDPVYPFLFGNLHLNAAPLQMAIALFHILALRPLIDARLPEPPVIVFPSFEELLEENDPMTKAGMAALTVKVVAPALDAQLHSIDELYDYARKHEEAFCTAIMRERLFVPPGADPRAQMTAQEALDIYLDALEGVRDRGLLEKMKKMPKGWLVMNAVAERLRPQYHLLENANELDAQPLVSQQSHWHYFERCSTAEARDLVNHRIISPDSFDVLRALQDDSLAWLANIPVDGLVELRRNQEHAELREQLKKFTTQLTSTKDAELPEVAREVRHGLQVLIQRQQKALAEIQRKYSPKAWGAAVGAGLGAAVGASMFFMPALAAFAGVAAPAAAAMGALGGGATAYVRELTGKAVEVRNVRKTMLGMLAAARHGK
jgi:hypothetical protein